MIQAEWLLKNHQKHVSLSKMLEVQIRHSITKPIQHADIDDYIESLVLGGKSFDGLPHASRYSSKTEEIAISYREQIEAKQQNDTYLLQQQLRQTEYYIQLYDAVVAGLDPIERWIVEGHYLQSLSLNEMIRTAPDALVSISKSTLCRRKKDLLIKIDNYLQLIQSPSNKKSSGRFYYLNSHVSAKMRQSSVTP